MLGIRVDKVLAEWTLWSPTPPNGFKLSHNGREARIHWGFIEDDGQSAYGIEPFAPPIRYIRQGQRFKLARFRHYNQPILGSSPLTSATLELTFTFNKTLTKTIEITFNHNETVNSTGDSYKDRDFVSIQGGFPKTLNMDGVIIKLLGFQPDTGGLTSVYESPEKSTNTAYLIAELVDSGDTAPACSDDNKVFDPAKCEIPCIPPIDDSPAIEDCEVPGVPVAGYGCDGVDIPAIKSIAGVAISNAVGAEGPAGEPGPGAIIGQMVQIINANNWGEQHDAQSLVFHFESTNEYYIHTVHRTFTPTSGEQGYCFWVWSPCPDDEDVVPPAVDTDCPKTDTVGTSAENGYWVLVEELSTGYCTIPPPNIGKFYGEMIANTWYLVGTPGSIVGALSNKYLPMGAGGNPNATCDIDFGGTCTDWTGVSSTLTQSGANWTGTVVNNNGKTFDLLFFKYGTFGGAADQWMFVAREQLVGDENDGLTERCAFGYLNGATNGDPFLWSGSISNPYNCCDSATQTLTVTITD